MSQARAVRSGLQPRDLRLDDDDLDDDEDEDEDDLDEEDEGEDDNEEDEEVWQVRRDSPAP
jgi:hypothetical protein